MKTKGYTLAEVLITLTVIGVIAAVVAPLISKFRPDTHKFAYLRTYDAVVETIKTLAYDSAAYPNTIRGVNSATGTELILDYSKFPFYNPWDPTQNKSSKNKLCSAMARVLYNGEDKCIHDGSFSENEEAIEKLKTEPSFTARNGADFFVTTKVETTGTNEAVYQTDIYFDINGAKNGNNCMYSNDCKEPDIFKLIVDARGKIYPVDQMGATYLKHRKSTRKIDIQDAGLMVNESDIITPNADVLIAFAVTYDLPNDGSEGDPDEGPNNDPNDDLTEKPLEYELQDKEPLINTKNQNELEGTTPNEEPDPIVEPDGTGRNCTEVDFEVLDNDNYDSTLANKGIDVPRENIMFTQQVCQKI